MFIHQVFGCHIAAHPNDKRYPVSLLVTRKNMHDFDLRQTTIFLCEFVFFLHRKVSAHRRSLARSACAAVSHHSRLSCFFSLSYVDSCFVLLLTFWPRANIANRSPTNNNNEENESCECKKKKKQKQMYSLESLHSSILFTLFSVL